MVSLSLSFKALSLFFFLCLLVSFGRAPLVCLLSHCFAQTLLLQLSYKQIHKVGCNSTRCPHCAELIYIFRYILTLTYQPELKLLVHIHMHTDGGIRSLMLWQLRGQESAVQVRGVQPTCHSPTQHYLQGP